VGLVRFLWKHEDRVFPVEKPCETLAGTKPELGKSMAMTVVAFAPGRVELLGNHTDYNEGLVLAAAIDLGVTIRAERLGAAVLEVSSETNGRKATASLDKPQRLAGDSAWTNYPLGTVWALREAGLDVGGLRLHVTSTVPLGWGLSSSAAFEVATGSQS
jgi:galactokinase